MLSLVPIPLLGMAAAGRWTEGWSPHWDLNPRPLPYQGSALPAELCGPGGASGKEGLMVGREGIEPPQSKTADLQSAELTTCSTYPRGCCALLRSELRGEEVSAQRLFNLEPTTGLEPGTGGLQNRCSTN